MNPIERSKTRFQEWATRQLADYNSHQPGTIFAEGVMLNIAEGYHLQSAVAELRQQRGDRIIGYKVGCTSPIIRAQLGIDHCVSGRLYDSELHKSGAVLSRKEYANLAIEGELAIELSREPTPEDFYEMKIPACVVRLFPVVELHNLVMRGVQPSAGELIAHNALHAGIVRATGICPEEASGEPSLAIFVNAQLLEECRGPSLIQTIHTSLKWLMEMMRTGGDRLSTGQIILTGSIPSLIPIEEDCHIHVEAPPFGCVEVEFTI